MQTLLCSLVFVFSVQSLTVSDSIGQGATRETHTVDISSFGNGNQINIKFQVTGSYNLTSTFLMASFDKFYTTAEINDQSFYGENPNNYQHIDLDAMWSFKEQYINLQKVSGKNSLKFTVFKFDPSNRDRQINYVITYEDGGSSSSVSCSPCANNETQLSTCYCQDCVSGSGKYCSRQIQQITQNLQMAIPASGIKYFEIPTSVGSNLQVQMTLSLGLGQAYAAFVDFDDEVASFYNVQVGDTGPALFTLVQSRNTSLSASLIDRPLSLTIVNLNNFESVVTIVISASSTVSVLVVVLGILGGILFIVLVIGAYCLVKRSHQENSRVEIEGELPSDSQKLSADQIERYFPRANFQQVLGGETNQNTMENLQNKIPDDLDCVICLEKVTIKSNIRMGFCKHIFHSQCLLKWFRKQRNCPYCRKEFNRTTTSADYERLMSENGNKVLKDLKLVQAIYRSNPPVQQG